MVVFRSPAPFLLEDGSWLGIDKGRSRFHTFAKSYRNSISWKCFLLSVLCPQNEEGPVFYPKSAEAESLFSFRIITVWLYCLPQTDGLVPFLTLCTTFTDVDAYWKISLFKASGPNVPEEIFCPYCSASWAVYVLSFLQEPRVNHNLCGILVCRRLLAHPGQKAVEFWKQWHLCTVTPVVLHLLGIHHDMAGPLSRQFELTVSGCWQTPFSRLYSTDGVPLFPPTLQSRYWSWAPLDVVLLISPFPSLQSRFYTFLCSLQPVAWEQVGIFNLSEYWELLLTWCLCHLSLLFWLLTGLLACAARNVRRESRLLFRDAGSPFPSQDFSLSDQFEDLHLVLILPKASFPSL